MITSKDLVQRLNLLKNSISFVLRELGSDGSANVLDPERIPANHGIYWVPGETILPSGRRLPSVFRVDTDSGGELTGTYWFIGDKWYDQQDADTLPALSLTRAEVFPYDWRFNVPLERDIFHPPHS